MNRRAVAYVRVSTADQAREGVSLEAQEERVRAYCTMAGLELVSVLREEGVSAGKPLATRPLGKQLLSLIAEGQVQHVIALKLDRLFRDAADCLNQTRAWDRAGIALHFVDLGGQTLNTGSAMGRMFLTMTAAFAELERNLIAERTSTALQHKRKHGARLGAAPTGWRKVCGQDGKATALAIDHEGRALLFVLRALRAAGKSFREICAQLQADGVETPSGAGRWFPATVQKLLRRASVAETSVSATESGVAA